MLLAPLLSVLPWLAPWAGERVEFAVADGTKLLKKLRIGHELQLEGMGSAWDDSPFVSDGSGGWLSAWLHLDLLDEYVKGDRTRPLELKRSFLDIAAEAKATVTRGGGQKLEESSHMASPLRSHTVLFTWVDDEGDWSRCYDRIEADEEWLAQLRGEFDLLALLPGREVSEGEQWDVDVTRLREVFAPGGNLLMIPTKGNLFGRVVELGVAGDYADFLGPECAGAVVATFKGTRAVAAPAAEGEESAEPVRVGVIELDLNLALVVDRTRLYLTAMPDSERREAARLESVPLEYTLVGQGELLWDLEAGHFHSLVISGRESYSAQIIKTRFAGKEQHKEAQQTRYSGTLSFELTTADGSAIDTASSPKGKGKGKGKKQK